MLLRLLLVAVLTAACLAQDESKFYYSLLDAIEKLSYEYMDSFQLVGSIHALSRELSSDQNQEVERIVSKHPQPMKELKAELEKFVRSLPQELQAKQKANLKEGIRSTRAGMRPRTKFHGAWLSEAALSVIKEVMVRAD